MATVDELTAAVTTALQQLSADEATVQAAVAAVESAGGTTAAPDANVTALVEAATAFAVSQGFTAPADSESAGDDSAEDTASGETDASA